MEENSREIAVASDRKSQVWKCVESSRKEGRNFHSRAYQNKKKLFSNFLSGNTWKVFLLKLQTQRMKKTFIIMPPLKWNETLLRRIKSFISTPQELWEVCECNSTERKERKGSLTDGILLFYFPFKLLCFNQVDTFFFIFCH